MQWSKFCLSKSNSWGMNIFLRFISRLIGAFLKKILWSFWPWGFKLCVLIRCYVQRVFPFIHIKVAKTVRAWVCFNLCGSGFLCTTQGSSLPEKVPVSGAVLWTQLIPSRWGGKPACTDWAVVLGAGTAALADWWTQQPLSWPPLSLQHTLLGEGKLDKARAFLWGMVRFRSSCCCCHVRRDHPHWSLPHNLLATPPILFSPVSFRPDPSLLMNHKQFANRFFGFTKFDRAGLGGNSLCHEAGGWWVLTAGDNCGGL